MPSPFPGMNPYLEQAEVWPDFHDSFLTYAREVLASCISPHYFVRIQDRVFIHEYGTETLNPLGRPDLTTVAAVTLPPASSATALLEAPTSIQFPTYWEELHQNYLEIVDRRNREVVTVLELLSPSNKYAGPDREQYWQKVLGYLRTPTHFVELDLLRGGPRMSWVGLPGCDYYALVSRAAERPRAGLWPIGLRDPLPTIPIPLRPGDTEPRLDLQAVLHRVYDAAGYEYSIYDGRPDPPLSEADAAWAASLVPSARELPVREVSSRPDDPPRG